MKTKNRTPGQPAKEIQRLRQRIAELEASGRQRNRFEETLRIERDKAQQYLDIAEVILVALNKKGEITLINRRGNQILGYKEGKLLGENWFTICLPSHLRKKMKSGFLKLMAGEREITEFYENPVLTKSGTERIIAWHNTLLKDAQGATIGTLSSGEDITERKQAEAALKESERRFRTIFEGAIDGILLADIETKKFHTGNAMICKMLGYSLEEIKNLSVMDIHPQESLPFVMEQFDKLAKEEITKTSELPVKRKDGSVFYAEISTVMLKLDGGSYLMGTFRDIAERKQAEKELRESEERFRRAFENANTGVCLVDLEGNLTRVNSKMCEIFGYTKEELERMTVNDIAHPEDIDTSPEFIQKTLQGEIDRATFEKRYFHKKGHVVTCEVSSSLVRNAEGAPLCFISHVHDITDRKQAEAQIERNLRETSVRFEVSQSLVGKETEDEVLDALIQQAGLSPQAYVAILTFDRTEREPTIILRRRAPFESGMATVVPIGTRFPASRFPIMNLYSADQLFFSDNVMADERVDQASREMLRQAGAASLTFFPLAIGNEWEGFIVALAKPAGYFDEEKQRLYQTLAEQGAVALRAARLREQIRESQQRFQGLVETLSDWIWEVDQNGIYTYVSPKIRDLLGYEPEELLGKTPFDLMPPEEAERVADAFDKLLAAQQPIVALKNTCRHKDGRLVVFESSGVPFFDAEGRLRGYRGVDRDITERKRLEEILEREREELKLIIDSSPIIVFYKDTEGRFIRVNKTLAEALNMPEENFVGKTVFDLYSPQIARGMTDDDQEVIRSRRPKLKIIEQYESASGIRWAQTDKIPICGKDGVPIALIGFAQDITERKRAEAALRESEEKYRDLVENINDILYATDEQGIVTYVAPAIESLSGYTTSEIIGHPFSEFVYQEDLLLAREEFQEVVSGLVKAREYRMVNKSGVVRWVRTSSRPLFKESRFIGLRGVMTDITDRKQAEEEVKRGYEQLRETLHATVNALASTVEMKDQYTAGHQPRVTHLACAIAAEMGLPAEQIEGIRMAASIHDIGKIMVPAEILNKPGPLTEIQYEMIKMHPRAGYDILKGLKLPWPVAAIILQHHELMDGSGYPQGLSGEKIMVEARILTVANVVEAMNAHRPYRPAFDIKVALAEISKNRGILYDSAVVDACLRLFIEKGFTLDSVPR
jgi:PAS domain S-box-containing protein